MLKKIIETLWLIWCGICRNGYQQTLRKRSDRNGRGKS